MRRASIPIRLLDPSALLRRLRRDWVQASVLVAEGWSRRDLRYLAHAARGAIISGDLGYRATRYATPDERRAAVARLTAQASHMAQRARQIERWTADGRQGGRLPWM